jgi:hypothetical protein
MGSFYKLRAGWLKEGPGGRGLLHFLCIKTPGDVWYAVMAMQQDQRKKDGPEDRRAMLRRIDLFGDLSDAETDSVLALMRGQKVRKGGIVFHQFDESSPARPPPPPSRPAAFWFSTGRASSRAC